MADAASSFYNRNTGIAHYIFNQLFTAAWQADINHTNSVQDFVNIAVVVIANLNKLNCFRNSAFNTGQSLANYADNFYI